MIDVKSVDSNEVNKTSQTENKSFDPDKRIDVNQGQDIKGKNEFDPNKRLESQEIKCDMAIKKYINDLKGKSECSDTIITSEMNASNLERQSPEKVAELREEFDDNKSKLRKEWEKENNREWPKYTVDIYNNNGQIIRRKGDNYDAHHIHPLCLGGKNEVPNITPLDVFGHRDIHATNGSCKNLIDTLGGKYNE